MVKKRLTDAAEEDLTEIWSYLALETSEDFATQFVAGITTRFDQALQFPLSGASRSHLAPGLRVIFHDKYAIYYLPRPKEIVIVRVLHGSRDIEAIAEEEGFAF